MTLRINPFLKNIKPYSVASHKIWSVDPSVRKNILKLDWNESTMPPSPVVKERIEQLLKTENFFNLYPSTYNGNLLELIASYIQLPIKNIQYFASSDSIHEYISKMYLQPGDGVLILAPSYDNFRLTAEANGAKVYYSEVNSDFSFDAQRFEKDITKIQPEFVYIVNPNNPVGYGLLQDYIEHLIVKYPDIIFLVDEAYAEFSGKSVKDLVLRYNNILITRTLSKAFGLANFRFGYLLASEDNIKAISGIRNPKNITTFAQEAAIAAFSDVQYMQNYVNEVCKTRDDFIQKINTLSENMKAYPSVTNFVMIQFDSIERKKDFINYLLKNDIYVRELMQGPLVERCIRITIGTHPQMERVLKIINEFIEGNEA